MTVTYHNARYAKLRRQVGKVHFDVFEVWNWLCKGRNTNIVCKRQNLSLPVWCAEKIHEIFNIDFRFIKSDPELPLRAKILFVLRVIGYSGKMVWNDQLKREVPEGWEICFLSDLCSISTSQCNPSRLAQNEIEPYSIPAFDAGIFPSFDAPQSILSNKFYVPKQAILYSKLNAQFKRIWDPLHITDAPIASSEFVVYVPKNISYRGYVYAILNGEQFFKFANSISSCSTGSRKRFTPETTCHFQVVLPPENILVSFSHEYSAILAAIRIARLEIDALRKRRDFLLPLLMNGQVEVRGDK